MPTLDPWFERFRSVRSIDAAEYETRKAVGLTQHSYDTILAAAINCWDAHDAWLEAYAETQNIINMVTTEEDRKFPAWERFAPEWLQDLMATAQSAWESAPPLGYCIVGSRGRAVGGNTEYYPITRWTKDARRFRSAARVTRTALLKAMEHHTTARPR